MMVEESSPAQCQTVPDGTRPPLDFLPTAALHQHRPSIDFDLSCDHSSSNCQFTNSIYSEGSSLGDAAVYSSDCRRSFIAESQRYRSDEQGNCGGPPERGRLCAGCGLPFADPQIALIGGRYYHRACAVCFECSSPLTDHCYAKDGELYCYDDYVRSCCSFHCASCGSDVVPGTEIYSICGHTYHLLCFRCQVCGKHIQENDRLYLLSNAKLLCESDYNDLSAWRTNKRVRTTISLSQLDALKAAYHKNPKPNRPMRQSLSIETGLGGRVVQVWFQNSRAKDKRLNGLANLRK